MLVLKFLFLAFVMVISNLEYISFGCCELKIADEGSFYFGSCCCLLSCFDGRKAKYFKLADESLINNNNSNNYNYANNNYNNYNNNNIYVYIPNTNVELPAID